MRRCGKKEMKQCGFDRARSPVLLHFIYLISSAGASGAIGTQTGLRRERLE